MSNDLSYPRTVKVGKWTEYLGRNLYVNEMKLLHNVMCEKSFNKKMVNLYNNCVKYNYHVPILTHLHGNCLFECLVYNGIGMSVKELRSGIAYLMYQFSDYKQFFEGRDDTLKELFNMTNEIEYVHCSDDNKLYKYTYEIMCEDLANDCSWGNLPTELILLVISNLYKIKFEIITNGADNLTSIHAFENNIQIVPELNILRLGHIIENHYIPIDVLKADEDFKPLFYDEAKRKFHLWGEKMEEIKQEELSTNKKEDKINTDNNDHEYGDDQFVDMSKC